MEKKKKGSFSGQLGFVLAAAGSAVGVGNLWRFPYLVAKDGGGLFLLIYFALILTFGFTLLFGQLAQKNQVLQQICVNVRALNSPLSASRRTFLLTCLAIPY